MVQDHRKVVPELKWDTGIDEGLGGATMVVAVGETEFAGGIRGDDKGIRVRVRIFVSLSSYKYN